MLDALDASALDLLQVLMSIEVLPSGRMITNRSPPSELHRSSDVAHFSSRLRMN